MNPREVMDAYGLNPKKSLGQNFMHDPNTIEKIVTTAEIMPEDTVVEIGPGTGELTARLADYARHVMAIEIDERLEPLLSERFANIPNVYFVFQDILKGLIHINANVSFIESCVLKIFNLLVINKSFAFGITDHSHEVKIQLL